MYFFNTPGSVAEVLNDGSLTKGVETPLWGLLTTVNEDSTHTYTEHVHTLEDARIAARLVTEELNPEQVTLPDNLLPEH